VHCELSVFVGPEKQRHSRREVIAKLLNLPWKSVIDQVIIHDGGEVQRPVVRTMVERSLTIQCGGILMVIL
jgi:hypothetical protein